MPAEQDGAIQAGANEGGFWYPTETPKPVAELVAEYEDSFGHNSNYMLELSPDNSGALPVADVAAYAKFGETLTKCYGSGAALNTTNTTHPASTFNSCPPCALSMKVPAITDRLLIQEDVAGAGQRVRAYAIYQHQAQPPGSPWIQIATGNSIGHGRIHRLTTPVPAGSWLTLEVLDSVGIPVIRAFSAFSLAACMG
jgi:alpha-L-fucosidase